MPVRLSLSTPRATLCQEGCPLKTIQIMAEAGQTTCVSGDLDSK
jgi:hypothetical protein